jgi:hypothetical protein
MVAQRIVAPDRLEDRALELLVVVRQLRLLGLVVVLICGCLDLQQRLCRLDGSWGGAEFGLQIDWRACRIRPSRLVLTLGLRDGRFLRSPGNGCALLEAEPGDALRRRCGVLQATGPTAGTASRPTPW